METILITGGAGFIGTNFVKYFIGKYPKTKCIVLDKLTYAGNLSNLDAELRARKIIFIRGDITDTALVTQIFKKYSPDIVVNFAAESHVDRSIVGPQVFMRTNILGTQNLISTAKKSWEIRELRYDENVKFIHISTDEVYGSLREGYFTETSPLNPRSPYSASKASADLIINSYCSTYNFPAVITRCSNNYGPYQFLEKLMPLMIKNIISGKKLPVYGDGTNERDWIYVNDHCTAIDAVIKAGRIGAIYNVGADNGLQNIELVKLLIDKVRELIKDNPSYNKVLNTDLKNIDYELISFVKDRLGHDFRYAIDASRIKTELGWRPVVPFDEGVVATVKWYLENFDWIESIEAGNYQKYNKTYGDLGFK